MDCLNVPPDYVRSLTTRLLKQPRKGIQDAYKGSAADLAVICDNLSKLPISLHAKMMNMFISHVPQDGSQLPPDKLNNMYQALHGILTIMYAWHTTSESCQHNPAINWTRVLDCAEFILDADFSDSCLSHDHLEKQVSSVFQVATHNSSCVSQFYDSFGERTVGIISRLLLTQYKRTDWSWNNEESVAFFNRYKSDVGILSAFVKATGDDRSQITDILAARLRTFSKERITMQSLACMEPILFLISVLINEYDSKRRAKHNMYKVKVVAKTLSAIASALNSPENRDEERFQVLAAQTILDGLLMYNSIFEYLDLPFAVAVVRLGLFDVILAINPILIEVVNLGVYVGHVTDIMNALFGRVLPELLPQHCGLRPASFGWRQTVSDPLARLIWRCMVML